MTHWLSSVCFSLALSCRVKSVYTDAETSTWENVQEKLALFSEKKKKEKSRILWATLHAASYTLGDSVSRTYHSVVWVWLWGRSWGRGPWSWELSVLFGTSSHDSLAQRREREKCGNVSLQVVFFFWPKTDNCCRVTVNMWFPRNHSEWVWPVLEPIGKFGVFQKKGLLLISQKHEWPTVVREEIFHRWFYGMLFFFFFFCTVTRLNLKCSFINFNHKYFYSFLGNNFVWLFRKVFSFNTFLLVTLWQSFCFCFLFCFLKLLFMLLLLWEAKLQLFS